MSAIETKHSLMREDLVCPPSKEAGSTCEDFSQRHIQINEELKRLWKYIQDAVSPETATEKAISSPVTLISDSGETIPIPQSLARKILSFDEFGNEKRVDASFRGHHPVMRSREIYFKRNLRLVPLDPLMEMAIYDFYSLFLEPSVAPSRVVIARNVEEYRFSNATPINAELLQSVLDGKQEDFLQKHPEFRKYLTIHKGDHILQASLAVNGTRLKEFLERQNGDDTNLLTLEPETTSNHIVISGLTIPGDHKPENFIIEDRTNRLVNIDYDSVFHHANVSKTAEGAFREIQPFAGCKNILFLLRPLMQQHLHEKTEDRISAIQPEELLLNWLWRQHCRNLQIKELCTAYSLKSLFTQSYIPLMLREKTVKNLLNDLYSLQRFLLNNPDRKHQDIIEFFHPDLLSYYSWMLSQHGEYCQTTRKLYSTERPLEEGRNPNARVGIGALKGRWLFESLISIKKDRNQTIGKALVELLDTIDIAPLEKQQAALLRMVKLLQSFYESYQERLPRESTDKRSPAEEWKKDPIQQWNLLSSSLRDLIEKVDSYSEVEKKRAIQIPSCERLLKNRDDDPIRQSVAKDIFSSFMNNTLPQAMATIYPYGFLVKQLQQSYGTDSRIKEILYKFCMRPEVYEDFIVFTFEEKQAEEMPEGIKDAINLLNTGVYNAEN